MDYCRDNHQGVVLLDLPWRLWYSRLDAGDVAWSEARYKYRSLFDFGDWIVVDSQDMVARQGHEVDNECMVGHSGLGLQFGICQQSRALWILAIPARQYTFIIYKDIACGCYGEHDYGADDSCANSNHCCVGIIVSAAMVDMAFI